MCFFLGARNRSASAMTAPRLKESRYVLRLRRRPRATSINISSGGSEHSILTMHSISPSKCTKSLDVFSTSFFMPTTLTLRIFPRRSPTASHP